VLNAAMKEHASVEDSSLRGAIEPGDLGAIAKQIGRAVVVGIRPAPPLMTK
jgi:hypothetical protein